MPRLLLILCLLALPLVGAACRFDEPIEVPLVFEHEPQEDRIDDTIPLLFSGWERQPEKDETRAWLLWPLVHYVREGRETVVDVLGARLYSSRVDHRGFRDLDVIAGPVLYGRSVDEGSYLAVLPFGGTLKGLLGKDKATIVLFPLFFQAYDKQFGSTHVLFPFINVWHGGGRSGFRVFPFYGHYERTDREGRLANRRTWVLWPLFLKAEENMNSPAGPTKRWFVFPFYGRSDGPDTHQWTFLFPFFKYFENRGSSFNGPAWDLRAPWPFVRIVRGRKYSITDIWPFYGVQERRLDPAFGEGPDIYRRRFVLWPIWRDEQHTTGTRERERFWVFPIFWSFKSQDRSEGWREREVKLWPLFRYKRWADGRRAINVLSPLWFKDPEGAFERIYGPLTRVYHEWTDREGARRLELLWGLFQQRDWVDARPAVAAAPAEGAAAPAPEGVPVERTSLFFGMFQYERRGGLRSLRFFWLPTGPEWGEGAAPPPEGGEPAGGGVGGQRTPG